MRTYYLANKRGQRYLYGMVGNIGRHKPCDECGKVIKKGSLYTRIHTSAQRDVMRFCQNCEGIS